MNKNWNFKLTPIDFNNQMQINQLYHWYLNEDQKSHFTCRPIGASVEYPIYIENLKEQNNIGIKHFLLQKYNDNKLIYVGKITLFDYNPRNHSAEFGYYLPREHRGKGYGKIIVQYFMQTVFQDGRLDLNKLYATTASNNFASIKLLETFGFSLDGRLREHYWLDEEVHDQLVYSLLKREFIPSVFPL